MIILYTKPNCPLCNTVKRKLKEGNIEYIECNDENKMDELNIDNLPVAQIDNNLLQFKDILNYITKEAKT